MRIPRVTGLALGVTDLAAATSLYRNILETPPNTSFDGVTTGKPRFKPPARG